MEYWLGDQFKLWPLMDDTSLSAQEICKVFASSQKVHGSQNVCLEDGTIYIAWLPPCRRRQNGHSLAGLCSTSPTLCQHVYYTVSQDQEECHKHQSEDSTLKYLVVAPLVTMSFVSVAVPVGSPDTSVTNALDGYRAMNGIPFWVLSWCSHQVNAPRLWDGIKMVLLIRCFTGE